MSCLSPVRVVLKGYVMLASSFWVPHSHFFPLIANCLLETGENFARFTRVSAELATILSYRRDQYLIDTVALLTMRFKQAFHNGSHCTVQLCQEYPTRLTIKTARPPLILRVVDGGIRTKRAREMPATVSNKLLKNAYYTGTCICSTSFNLAS